jgi:hypothetical protein
MGFVVTSRTIFTLSVSTRFTEHNKKGMPCVISGFRRDVKKICVLLGFYATYIGSSTPTFRDNLSNPSLRPSLLGLLDS